MIRKLAGFKNVPWSFLMVSRTCSLQKIAGSFSIAMFVSHYQRVYIAVPMEPVPLEGVVGVM